eukprot:SAG22_NODE_247_length_13918_cov_7.885375_2_plen_1010_part_00
MATVDDLDFEEVSLLRERSEALKKEYRSYLVAHPELTQLLSDLVNSCLVHKPEDVFEHTAGHFGLGVVSTPATEMAQMLDKFAQLKAMLDEESGGQSLADIIKFVFWEYDGDNNGTLETDEWLEFLTTFPDGKNVLEYDETSATKVHEWICGETDGHMAPMQLMHALSWIADQSGEFEPLSTAAAETAAITGVVANPMAAAAAEEAPAAAAGAHKIIFCGPPGSGKGVQCEKLISKYGLEHISTGTLLQKAIAAGSEHGLAAKQYIEAGETVPEELAGDLVVDGMKGLTGGWLLDGFPRSKEQAAALNAAGVVPTTLLVLDVPDSVLVEKSTGRRLDPETGKMYHTATNPPPADVAERVIQRADDAEDVVKTRLATYAATKAAVCGVFLDQVRTVNGDRADDVVAAEIVKVLETGADADMEASAAKIQASFRGKKVRAKKAAGAGESGPATFATEMDKWIAFKAALMVEAKAGGYQLPVLLKHVFWSFDSDNNGELDKGEWKNFLNDIGKPHGLVWTQAESDAFHKAIVGVGEGKDMSPEELETYMLKLVKADEEAAAAVAEGGAAEGGAADGASSTKYNIIICGAPASGKGGQCEMLVEKYKVKHVSTGDLLRAAVAAGSEAGLAAKAIMDEGKLVPDEMLVSVVAAGLKDVTEGWLLDGFPRSKEQAQALKDAGVVPDVLLVLDVPDSVLVDKCVQRRLDPETGKMYHLATDPPPADVAERVIQRADDSEEKTLARLAQYNETKEAVCEVYAAQAKHVSADKDEAAVSADIVTMLETGAVDVAAEAAATGEEAEAVPVLGVCVIGPPASGKGALSQNLATEKDLTQILFGDLIRDAMASESALGVQAKESIDKDEEVPDAVLVQLATEAIKACGGGWLMDGFPRNAAQAQAMQDSGVAPNVVLLVDVSDEELLESCTNRRIDPETGDIYNLKTDAEGMAEEVAGRLIQRLDDTEERVKERLALFQAQKDEVCTAFADLVQVVDGSAGAEAMAAEAGGIVDGVNLTDS